MTRSNRGSCRSARHVTSERVAGHAGDPDPVSDEVLLRICGAAHDDPRITPACGTDLRSSSALIGAYAPRRHRLLCAALALLTAVLAQLSPWVMGDAALGGTQPITEACGWVDRAVLQGAAVRIASLHWPDVEPEIVALVVQSGVDGAARLGFLSERACAGNRSIVAVTSYGITRARQVAAAAMPSIDAERGHARRERSRAHAAAGDVVPVGPKVQLGLPGEPCRVLGKLKRALTDAQHAVVSTLISAGDAGMSKDSLENVRPSARRILRQLYGDSDWAKVIVMPGQTNGRYRIRT